MAIIETDGSADLRSWLYWLYQVGFRAHVSTDSVSHAYPAIPSSLSLQCSECRVKRGKQSKAKGTKGKGSKREEQKGRRAKAKGYEGTHRAGRREQGAGKEQKGGRGRTEAKAKASPPPLRRLPRQSGKRKTWPLPS